MVSDELSLSEFEPAVGSQTSVCSRFKSGLDDSLRIYYIRSVIFFNSLSKHTFYFSQ